MSEVHVSEVRAKAGKARAASVVMNRMTTAQKNAALSAMADALITEQKLILSANEQDLDHGRSQGTSSSLLDRLKLTPERIKDMADGLRQVIELQDPVGETVQTIQRPNGLHITQIRVPLGVIGMIYEARPNVTVDAAGLCLKTGNAVVLRGGSAALYSNTTIINVLRQALQATDIPPEALQLIEDSNRSSVDEMLKLNDLLDVIIPRGGSSLIQNVVQNATVPVIETGAGICHTYLDASATVEMAEAISLNAKVQRPSVCNSMETLLVHQDYADRYLTALGETFRKAGVEVRGCQQTQHILPWAAAASAEDFATEYNDYILNVRIVQNLDEALEHISKYGTRHSECIITENTAHANRFLQEVDAAAVYHNASTRFTDGFEFGFGAEIGISTQKLHARGPMGLPALTSTKYRVQGNGQIRG
ncbi:glutamate-5-semialdehyde dehydrogenase [Paenibacillus sp. JX-17]|uniref:Gamma-glutamyl phosphate reductase n=1 Tax=Paenibacillus lacisoli TaxID=3064525 RepID=A0ABT9C6Y7_9BACL|nr:glutamate-5-semialdehyde dehydrogenase [Paenibacillus sp. JX-17]MDO7905016.1 glutamate-5-semialdehyde dehydrogenase [Paenibacillus sp. JX-17]